MSIFSKEPAPPPRSKSKYQEASPSDLRDKRGLEVLKLPDIRTCFDVHLENSSEMNQVDLNAIRIQLLNQPRHSDVRRLTYHGHKVFSQNDEDGIIQEIFKRIGTSNRIFVEFGVGNGLECNSLWLLMQGWSGLWIEADKDACEGIRASHSDALSKSMLRLDDARVTIANINHTISKYYNQLEIDLLVIDIDFNDYWVWKELDVVNPRVVVIEYNATWAPPASITVPYVADGSWNGTNYFGASLSALATLGKSKGYELVGCCLAGVNAFFVRSDLIGSHFISPGSVEDHYEPARYFFASLLSGHPPGTGPVVDIATVDKS